MIEIIISAITIAPWIWVTCLIIGLWGFGCGLVWMGYKTGLDALIILALPFFATGGVLLLSVLFTPDYGLQMINITWGVP